MKTLIWGAYEKLLRTFIFLAKLLQSDTFPGSTCMLLQHLWSLATFNYTKGPRIDFSWSTGWGPASMVQILTSNIVRGEKCKTGLKSEVCANQAEEKGGLQVWMEYKMIFNRPVTQNSQTDAKHFNGLSLERKIDAYWITLQSDSNCAHYRWPVK